MDFRTISIVANPMPREAWLSYNGIRAIKVDRNRMANTCQYFKCLLNGYFKESKQNVIDIWLGDLYSYQAFNCVISYANDNIFIPEVRNITLYIEAIQLAIFWGYEDFIELLENLFIRILDLENYLYLWGLSKRYLYYLQRLDDACDEFDVNQQIDIGRRWPRCPIDGHQRHCYINCLEKPGTLQEDNWEETVSQSSTVLPDEQRVGPILERKTEKELKK